MVLELLGTKSEMEAAREILSSELGPNEQKRHWAWPPRLASQRKMGIRSATSPHSMHTCPSPKVERHGVWQIKHSGGEDAMY